MQGEVSLTNGWHMLPCGPDEEHDVKGHGCYASGIGMWPVQAISNEATFCSGEGGCQLAG